MNERGWRCLVAGCWLAVSGCDDSTIQTGNAATTDTDGSTSATSEPGSSGATSSGTTSDAASETSDPSTSGSDGETKSDAASDTASEVSAASTTTPASESSVVTSSSANTGDAGEMTGGTEADASAETGLSTPVDWAAPTPDVCSFEIGVENGAFISTVGLVEWSTDLADVSQARIEFVLTAPESGEVNRGSGGEISPSSGRALLLGLKSGRRYTYHIVVSDGETECVSPDQYFVTPTVPDLPEVTQVTTLPDAVAPGFILAASYGRGPVVILDADGDVVWWYDTTLQTSRVHMDWAGEYVWMMNGNGSFGPSSNGDVVRVKIDGSEVESISGLEYSHHDFAVLPDGVTAYLVGDPEGNDDGSYLVERAADGILTNLVRLDADSYVTNVGKFHANALRYYASDDSYTVGDLSLGGIAKFNRQGQLQMQYGYCPTEEPKCVPVSMPGNHGHQLLENGNLLFFLATIGNPSTTVSPVYEYAVTEANGAHTATEVWSYSADEDSLIFGDVERLDNGNTLITYSASGVIVEVTPDKQVARKLTSTNFGYSTFRKTLYGPPQ